MGDHRDRCRHFNGIQHKTCLAGVRYEDVKEKKTSGPSAWPCIDTGHGCPDTCPQRSFLTQEEHAARDAEISGFIARVVAAHADGKCHVCGKDIEPSTIVGRCKYAACGHRLGQVATQPESDEP